ncbi:MAG: DUF6065 family protein, partial [Planctomycetia bacterium]|nr:DUF6065 family protein [Planctomycetia bacterium]
MGVPDCPRCRALEQRIAELERRVAGAGGGPASPPPLVVKALRMIGHGWGEGWALRPSPTRRHWMDQARHSYLCLPMVVLNQWGWQVICPTDVRVTRDGSPGKESLRVE